MNFNTANHTFRQLMANGLSYRVPLFQRDYTWGADEWDDLWHDLVGLFGPQAEPAHYMGYLVLQTADNREFDIIDGQQRLTTLSLLVLGAISHLTDLAASGDVNDPQFRRAGQLRDGYIGYLDPVSLVPRSKLSLNRHNDQFYQNHLVPLEQIPQRGLTASEHLLRRGFYWLKDRISNRFPDSGESVARFVDVVVDKLFFTVFTVTDELNAFKVFETLNARGVRLSATDLLKNHLFSVVSRSHVREAEVAALEKRWESIVGLLGSESFPEFLRFYWNSCNRLVRKSELFKAIRSNVTERGKVFELVRDLDRHARVYSALRSPEDGFWSAGERDSLAQLQMFNVRQPLSLLLAAFDRFEGDRTGFERLLHAVAVVSFRYNVICSRQSNEQEVVYNRIAVDISSGRIRIPNAAVAELRRVYPNDGEFKASFADKVLRTTSSRNKKVARFILFRLERHVSAGSDFDFESARYDIEHVLPERPQEGWDQFDEQQREAFTYRLGNLSLLTTAINREIGNAAFAEKRVMYGSSEFAITRRLSEEYDAWNVDKIRSRQNWMARQATAIWRIEF